MKHQNILSAALGTALYASSATAYPGMGRGLQEIAARAAANLEGRQATTELLADLITLPDSELTPAGAAIKKMLLTDRTEPPQDVSTVYVAPGPLGSAECAADTCCAWKFAADEMAAAFVDPATGECNGLARQAIRLGFHDAADWSKTLGGGGADGSIVLANEWQRVENSGLDDIAAQMNLWYDEYHDAHGLSMADLIQMSANVATVVCPLGPRVRSFVGRPDSETPAIAGGQLPEVTDSGESLVALFADKTINLNELIALIGAHSTSRQRFVDPSQPGAPQDSTPGVWDVKFYNETLDENRPSNVFVFASDTAIAAQPGALAVFQAFANPNQRGWNNGYARAYVRLSVLGVQSINSLVECTGVLPLPITVFPPPSA